LTTLMQPRTLKFKVVLYLSIALSVAMLLFTGLVAWFLYTEILGKVSDHVTQLSEVITKSTRFAMLQNQPAYVDRIIHDVANQEKIDRIRILSRDGKIIHSTHAPEIGQWVDRNAEACSHCHRSDQPLNQIPKGERTWTFKGANGEALLGSMEVIRNEPSCYNAACHQHSKETSVLGVLDIIYSLDEFDRKLRASTLGIAGVSLAFIVIASLSVGLFVHRLVYLPLRDLESGARRLSTGNLDQPIPVRGSDEFGKLATSFNVMTDALRNSRAELRDWAYTLEQKVEKRTQELRRAQAETVRGEKLASVGLLASGVAHELNNPLTGILTFSHLLRQKMPDKSPDAEDMDLVIRETKRCAAIIKRLLDFAREKLPEKKFNDINRVIEDTVRIVEQPAHLRDIEITLNLDRTLPPIWIDADQIKQVVMNMVVNAQHAVEQKGSIAISTRRVMQSQPGAQSTEPMPMVEIAIVDTGCGIPDKNLRRIFDPFFTSKDVGKGTGLGLSVSHGIVEAHGGLIDVQSQVGEGSTFRVLLPLTPPAVADENKVSEAVQ
jgi:two-component system NtrC family sensor kinase